MAADKRREFVRENRICFSFLGSGHMVADCKSTYTCRHCKQKHHSLLHVQRRPQGGYSQRSKPKESSVQSNASQKDFCTVVLPTARVYVEDSTEELQPFRALLDSGSQSSFITERAVQYLRLRRKHARVQITGIGDSTAAQCKGYVSLKVHSIRDPSIIYETTALILASVTGDTPSHNQPIRDWTYLDNLKLADPDLGRPGRIDIVLGADISFRCLTGQQILGQPHEPVAHATTFGWVVGGGNTSLTPSHRISANVAIDVPLSVLQTFWGREGIPEDDTKSYQKEEDKLCEEIFTATTTRCDDGKLQVCIPFKKTPPDVGLSREIAVRRLAGTEARLARDLNLRTQYEEFMEDYEAKGHMIAIQTSTENDCYLPHHRIIRTTVLTTKLRVVFDASAKTANGNSLNSQQLVGPTIQDDLFSILTRFRLHKVAINGDIAQMYRQIWVHPDHRDYQRILWRRKPQDPSTTFQLKTVTYGTASAPWLVTRALKWIAEKEQEKHPEAARIIGQDHYMDDLLSGADTPESAHRIQEQVTKILLSYGLPLRKWASNNEYVIRAITGDQALMTNPEDIVKTLGLKWDKTTDYFQFKVKLKEATTITKRSMISEIACTFDPLGMAAPIIVVAKMLYQSVWQTPTEWDQPLPEDIARKYQEFREQLSGLEKIKIPRWLGSLSSDRIELHAFSDASEKAYGAAIYLRVCETSEACSNLVAAKTRVAPVATVSLPRLELMAAVLGTQLMNQVSKALRRPVERKFYWTDSMITLGWIQAEPARFKTFIANRVAAIQELSATEDWNHVISKENPADLASRGILPEDFTPELKLMWFQGPTWLRAGPLPEKPEIPPATEECKKIKALHANTKNNPILDSIANTSSFTRLWRRTAWIIRFTSNCRSKEKNLKGEFSIQEKEDAIRKLIIATQREAWPREFKALNKNMEFKDKEHINSLMKTSSIANLNPFMDQDGVLRVGGRLNNSNLESSVKHPAILPYGHLSKIYLRELHVKTLHAGPTLLLATARQSYWIIRGPQLARQVVKECLECTRQKGATMTQQMGDLPKSRTEGHRAFHITGIDYAGPVMVKNRKGRGASTSKAYISVFVCFSTKAIHLELVSDLTSEAFIAALRRFIARRGKPRQLHSDNGTNFIVAATELKKLLQQEQFQQEFQQATLNDEIEWLFIPPSAPHQGGIWEAAVKSTKIHLKRVLGAALLTFEEYATVLCQIEAQLNSRPLAPLTEDSSNLEILTPGHFLIGQALNTAPDPSLEHLKENRLGRYQYLQKLQQDFWKKWNQEYLTSLQKRYKWQHPHENLKLDDLVLIKEDNTPPNQWRRGRVMAVHPGTDGHVRVAKLRTSQGEVSRPIVKLIRLAQA